MFTPFRSGEYIARKIPYEGVSIKEVTSSTLIDKFTSMLAQIMIGLTFLLILSVKYNYLSFGYSIIAFLILLVFNYLIYSGLNSESSIFRFAKTFLSKIKFIDKFFNGIESFKSIDEKIFKRQIFLSALLYLVICMQYALIFSAFDGKIGLITGILSASTILLIKNIFPPVTFGETGIREAVSVLVFSKLSLNEAVAVNTSLLIFLINLVIPSVMGIYFTLRTNRK